LILTHSQSGARSAHPHDSGNLRAKNSVGIKAGISIPAALKAFVGKS
jgi:hypothetical protein